MTFQTGVTSALGSKSAGSVLLLAPSNGLGGGIERYVQTLEWSFAHIGVGCHRLDLARAGVRSHLRMLADGRNVLRADPTRVRLVVGHRALLPVATTLARETNVHGISVLCHGSDAWGARMQVRRIIERRLMRRPDVRVVAASSFTAGCLAGDCRATILPPGLSYEWFGTLSSASTTAVADVQGIVVVTAFRLASWREKGLPQLFEALTALGCPDIRLVVCGSGEAPPDLVEVVGMHEWCTLRVGLSDRDLADQLASADLFVLATRTRPGRQASGEGFGLVLLEAQVAGTPVVVPAHGGSADAYVDGITGLSPADENVETLTQLLGSALADPGRLAWMGHRAAEWGREVFAPERYAELVANRVL